MARRALEAAVFQHIAALILAQSGNDDAVLVGFGLIADGGIDAHEDARHRRRVVSAVAVKHQAIPYRANGGWLVLAEPDVRIANGICALIVRSLQLKFGGEPGIVCMVGPHTNGIGGRCLSTKKGIYRISSVARIPAKP